MTNAALRYSKMPPKKGSSKLKQPSGFLTPQAQRRQELEEARNLDLTGAKKLIGQVVLDRDGREWVIQQVHKTPITQRYWSKLKVGERITYDVTPIPRPEYGEYGYIHRKVSDDDIDARNFGFNKGTQFRQIEGEFVHVETDFA